MMGTWEIIVILFIVLLLFGGKRLPELARSLGKGIKEFKQASREISEEIDLSETKRVPPSKEELPEKKEVSSPSE